MFDSATPLSPQVRPGRSRLPHARTMSARLLTRALCLAVLASVLCGADKDQVTAITRAYDQDIHPLIASLCIKCHGPDKQKGTVTFAPIDSGRACLDGREVWMKALTQLTTRDMPPEAEKQPSAEERARLLGWLKGLRHLATPDPGPATIRRLSRNEYLNTLRSLFGTELQLTVDLPNDSAGESFDNSLSLLLMEKYLLAADEVLDHLISSDRMQRHVLAGQMDATRMGVHEAGKPDGKERRFTQPAEVTAMIEIPVEGTYTIHVRAGAEQAGAEPVRLAVRFDTQVVGELKILARPKYPASYTCTAQLVPGKTRFSVIFMNPLSADAALATATSDAGKPDSGKARPPTANATAAPPQVRAVTIDAIDLIGPPAKSMTEVQRRLFVAQPSKEPGKELSKHDAARRILEPFIVRAFRRPSYDGEADALLKVFDLADSQDESFIDSVKLMLKAVLVSPQFLFRTPEDAPTAGDGVVRVGDHELATRLSYFLWSTMPDDELLQLAHQGTLHEPAILTAQIRRLIADPRARALVDTFVGSWLGLERFADAVVDDRKFPQMTPALREAMMDEVRAFISGLMRGDGSLLDLLDCNYTYMNGLTAKLYGNDEIKGATMQKVALSDGNRGGLIGMPAILMLTSRSNRTSPVKRGKWILETLFDASPPPPPPDVAPLDKQDTPENAHLTLRQKTERHRTDPACAACHRIMDPIGFGLENFDAIGRWRITDDTGGVVDAIGELPGKLHFTSPSELKRILMARKDEFVRMFTAKLLGYALGRHLGDYDQVVVDDLAEVAVKDRYQLDALIVRIATSYPFLNRRSIQ